MEANGAEEWFIAAIELRIGVKELVGIVFEEDDGARTTSSPETTK